MRNSAMACAFSMRSSSQPGKGGPRRQASYGLNGCTGVAYLGRSISKQFATAAAAPGSASSPPALQLPALECVAEVTAVLALLVTASACARVSGASACHGSRCHARGVIAAALALVSPGRSRGSCRASGLGTGLG